MGAARELLVTIDGPAGAGKSTAAEMLAKRLGYVHVSTGDVYRAVAWLALQGDVDLRDEAAVLAVIGRCRPELRPLEGRARAFAGGEDISGRLRAEEVGAAASVLSAHPRVRQALLDVQRRTAQWGGVVADGRDAGTVVFPDAAVKFYLDASAEERAGRRFRELQGEAAGLDPARVREEMVRRDKNDRGRAAAPLRIPPGAVVVDTTELSPAEVVERMMEAISAYRSARRRD